MARRHHYRRRSKEPMELDVTTFLNLMVVLVPFLLITAVFSRMAIVELDMPSTNPVASNDEPPFRVEVIVRQGGLEIGNGTTEIAALPKVDGEYDLELLSRHMVLLKQDHPEAIAASVLLEPSIAYDYLIQVMDRVRSVAQEQTAPETEDVLLAQVDLFTDISVGEAP